MTRCALLVLVAGLAACSNIRTARIESEPDGAEILVNELVVGKAPLEYGFDFADSNARYTVTARQEGYVDNFVKVSGLYLDGLEDSERPIRIKIEEDQSWSHTSASPLVNSWFEIEVNPNLDRDQVWTILNSIASGHFKAETMDPSGLYLKSEPKVRSFLRGLVSVQVKNQLITSIATETPLILKVMVESQINDGKGWRPFERVFQEDAAIQQELVDRLVLQ